MRTINEIQAVIQNVSGCGWYAGYGYAGTESTYVFSGGCYCHTLFQTKSEAKAEALEIARSFRNQALTLGAITREALPEIKQIRVGN